MEPLEGSQAPEQSRASGQPEDDREAVNRDAVGPSLTSPPPDPKANKSVKHLECAYHFSGPPGCKWTEEQCLYSHRITGQRAAPPVQVEQGRPPVAGKNAHSGNPVYNNWRNSNYPQGVAYNPDQGSPAINRQAGLTPDIRRQLDYIAAKAQHEQYQQQFLSPPTMGQFPLGGNAQPFNQRAPPSVNPDPSMATPMGSPAFAMPPNRGADVFLNYGGHTDQYGNPQGPYHLAAPAQGLTPQDLEVIQQCHAQNVAYQQQVEGYQTVTERQQAEIDSLRNELTRTQAELTQARKAQAVAIDAYLFSDFFSSQTILKYRQLCLNASGDLNKLARSLLEHNEVLRSRYVKEQAVARKENKKPTAEQDQALLARTRENMRNTESERLAVAVVRDDMIQVNKDVIVGLDNGLIHVEESTRLLKWFRAETEKSGDAEALRHVKSGAALQGFHWNAVLK